MEPSLDGARLRIKRAGEHIGALKRLQRRIEQVDYSTLSVHRNTHEPKQIDAVTTEYYSDSVEVPGIPVNPRWSILTSECVFSLRSALDYLVYALARLDSGKVRNRTQFPICSDECDFKQAIKRGNLAGLNAAHRAAIEALQPYNGGKWLLQLAAISNPDKHRELVATVPKNALDAAYMQTPAPTPGGRQVVMHLQMSRYIAFPDESPVIPTLDALKAQVAETIKQFDSEFERQAPIDYAVAGRRFYRMAVTHRLRTDSTEGH